MLIWTWDVRSLMNTEVKRGHMPHASRLTPQTHGIPQLCSPAETTYNQKLAPYFLTRNQHHRQHTKTSHTVKRIYSSPFPLGRPCPLPHAKTPELAGKLFPRTPVPPLYRDGHKGPPTAKRLRWSMHERNGPLTPPTLCTYILSPPPVH